MLNQLKNLNDETQLYAYVSARAFAFRRLKDSVMYGPQYFTPFFSCGRSTQQMSMRASIFSRSFNSSSDNLSKIKMITYYL